MIDSTAVLTGVIRISHEAPWRIGQNDVVDLAAERLRCRGGPGSEFLLPLRTPGALLLLAIGMNSDTKFSFNCSDAVGDWAMQRAGRLSR